MLEFLKQCKGVILVGAASGHERTTFGAYNLNAIFIEARPNVISGRILRNKKFKRYDALVTDADGQEYGFKISSNNGQSSSIFEFADHKKIWSKVKTLETIKLTSTTLNTLLKDDNLELYDAMIIDTQGSELMVLKGASNILPKMKYIMVEAADFEAYRGCCQVKDIEEFMDANEFSRYTYQLQVKKEGVGSYYDIIYTRAI